MTSSQPPLPILSPHQENANDAQFQCVFQKLLSLKITTQTDKEEKKK